MMKKKKKKNVYGVTFMQLIWWKQVMRVVFLQGNVLESGYSENTFIELCCEDVKWIALA
jgi:hypothetical protein